MTLNYAHDLPDDSVLDAHDPARDVAAAIAAVAEIMHGMQSGALPASAKTVIRLQRATARLEALVAELP